MADTTALTLEQRRARIERLKAMGAGSEQAASPAGTPAPVTPVQPAPTQAVPAFTPMAPAAPPAPSVASGPVAPTPVAPRPILDLDPKATSERIGYDPKDGPESTGREGYDSEMEAQRLHSESRKNEPLSDVRTREYMESQYVSPEKKARMAELERQRAEVISGRSEIADGSNRPIADPQAYPWMSYLGRPNWMWMLTPPTQALGTLITAVDAYKQAKGTAPPTDWAGYTGFTNGERYQALRQSDLERRVLQHETNDFTTYSDSLYDQMERVREIANSRGYRGPAISDEYNKLYEYVVDNRAKTVARAESDLADLRRRLNIGQDAKMNVHVGADGKATVDIAELRYRLNNDIRDEKAREAGYQGWANMKSGYAREHGYLNWSSVPSAEKAVLEAKQKELGEAASKEAEERMLNAFQYNRNLTVVDFDEKKTNDWISRLPFGFKTLASILVPVTAASYTPTGVEFKTERSSDWAFRFLSFGSTMVVATSKAWQASEGPHYLIRAFAPESLSAGEDYGSRSYAILMAMREGMKTHVYMDDDVARVYIAEARKNPLVAEYMFNQILALGDAGDADPRLTKAMAFAWGAVGLVTDFTVPDPIGASLSVVGGLLDGAGRLTKESVRVSRLIDKAVEGTDSYDDFIGIIWRTDPAAATIIENRVAARINVNASVSGNIANLVADRAAAQARIDAIEGMEEIKALRKELGKLPPPGGEVPPGREKVYALLKGLAEDHATVATSEFAETRLRLQAAQDALKTYREGVDGQAGKDLAGRMKKYKASQVSLQEAEDAFTRACAKDQVFTARWQGVLDDIADASQEEATAKAALTEAEKVVARLRTAFDNAETAYVVKKGDRAGIENDMPSLAAWNHLNKAEKEVRKLEATKRAAATRRLTSGKMLTVVEGRISADLLEEFKSTRKARNQWRTIVSTKEQDFATLGIDPNGSPLAAYEAEIARLKTEIENLSELDRLAKISKKEEDRIFRLTERLVSRDAKDVEIAEKMAAWKDEVRAVASELREGSGMFARFSAELESPSYANVLGEAILHEDLREARRWLDEEEARRFYATRKAGEAERSAAFPPRPNEMGLERKDVPEEAQAQVRTLYQRLDHLFQVMAEAHTAYTRNPTRETRAAWEAAGEDFHKIEAMLEEISRYVSKSLLNELGAEAAEASRSAKEAGDSIAPTTAVDVVASLRAAQQELMAPMISRWKKEWDAAAPLREKLRATAAEVGATEKAAEEAAWNRRSEPAETLRAKLRAAAGSSLPPERSPQGRLTKKEEIAFLRDRTALDVYSKTKVRSSAPLPEKTPLRGMVDDEIDNQLWSIMDIEAHEARSVGFRDLSPEDYLRKYLFDVIFDNKSAANRAKWEGYLDELRGQGSYMDQEAQTFNSYEGRPLSDAMIRSLRDLVNGAVGKPAEMAVSRLDLHGTVSPVIGAGRESTASGYMRSQLWVSAYPDEILPGALETAGADSVRESWMFGSSGFGVGTPISPKPGNEKEFAALVGELQEIVRTNKFDHDEPGKIPTEALETYVDEVAQLFSTKQTRLWEISEGTSLQPPLDTVRFGLLQELRDVWGEAGRVRELTLDALKPGHPNRAEAVERLIQETAREAFGGIRWRGDLDKFNPARLNIAVDEFLRAEGAFYAGSSGGKITLHPEAANPILTLLHEYTHAILSFLPEKELSELFSEYTRAVAMISASGEDWGQFIPALRDDGHWNIADAYAEIARLSKLSGAERVEAIRMSAYFQEFCAYGTQEERLEKFFSSSQIALPLRERIKQTPPLLSMVSENGRWILSKLGDAFKRFVRTVLGATPDVREASLTVDEALAAVNVVLDRVVSGRIELIPVSGPYAPSLKLPQPFPMRAKGKNSTVSDRILDNDFLKDLSPVLRELMPHETQMDKPAQAAKIARGRLRQALEESASFYARLPYWAEGKNPYAFAQDYPLSTVGQAAARKAWMRQFDDFLKSDEAAMGGYDQEMQTFLEGERAWIKSEWDEIEAGANAAEGQRRSMLNFYKAGVFAKIPKTFPKTLEEFREVFGAMVGQEAFGRQKVIRQNTALVPAVADLLRTLGFEDVPDQARDLARYINTNGWAGGIAQKAAEYYSERLLEIARATFGQKLTKESQATVDADLTAKIKAVLDAAVKEVKGGPGMNHLSEDLVFPGYPKLDRLLVEARAAVKNVARVAEVDFQATLARPRAKAIRAEAVSDRGPSSEEQQLLFREIRKALDLHSGIYRLDEKPAYEIMQRAWDQKGHKLFSDPIEFIEYVRSGLGAAAQPKLLPPEMDELLWLLRTYTPALENAIVEVIPDLARAAVIEFTEAGPRIALPSSYTGNVRAVAEYLDALIGIERADLGTLVNKVVRYNDAHQGGIVSEAIRQLLPDLAKETNSKVLFTKKKYRPLTDLILRNTFLIPGPSDNAWEIPIRGKFYMRRPPIMEGGTANRTRELSGVAGLLQEEVTRLRELRLAEDSVRIVMASVPRALIRPEDGPAVLWDKINQAGIRINSTRLPKLNVKIVPGLTEAGKSEKAEDYFYSTASALVRNNDDSWTVEVLDMGLAEKDLNRHFATALVESGAIDMRDLRETLRIAGENGDELDALVARMVAPEPFPVYTGSSPTDRWGVEDFRMPRTRNEERAAASVQIRPIGVHPDIAASDAIQRIRKTLSGLTAELDRARNTTAPERRALEDIPELKLPTHRAVPEFKTSNPLDFATSPQVMRKIAEHRQIIANNTAELIRTKAEEESASVALLGYTIKDVREVRPRPTDGSVEKLESLRIAMVAPQQGAYMGAYKAYADYARGEGMAATLHALDMGQAEEAVAANRIARAAVTDLDEKVAMHKAVQKRRGDLDFEIRWRSNETTFLSEKHKLVGNVEWEEYLKTASRIEEQNAIELDTYKATHAANVETVKARNASIESDFLAATKHREEMAAKVDKLGRELDRTEKEGLAEIKRIRVAAERLAGASAARYSEEYEQATATGRALDDADWQHWVEFYEKMLEKYIDDLADIRSQEQAYQAEVAYRLYVHGLSYTEKLLIGKGDDLVRLRTVLVGRADQMGHLEKRQPFYSVQDIRNTYDEAEFLLNWKRAENQWDGIDVSGDLLVEKFLSGEKIDADQFAHIRRVLARYKGEILSSPSESASTLKASSRLTAHPYKSAAEVAVSINNEYNLRVLAIMETEKALSDGGSRWAHTDRYYGAVDQPFRKRFLMRDPKAAKALKEHAGSHPSRIRKGTGYVTAPGPMKKTLIGQYGEAAWEALILDLRTETTPIERNQIGELDQILRRVFIDEINSPSPIGAASAFASDSADWGNTGLKLSPAEASVLQQQLPARMRALRWRTDPGNDALQTFRMWKLMRETDPAMRPRVWGRTKEGGLWFDLANIPGAVMAAITRTRMALHPQKSVMGLNISEEAGQIIKAAVNTSAHIDDELLLLVQNITPTDLPNDLLETVCKKLNIVMDKQTGLWAFVSDYSQIGLTEKNRAIIQIAALVRYMDSTEAIRTAGNGQHTIVNTLSSTSLWENGLLQMLSDGRNFAKKDWAVDPSKVSGGSVGSDQFSGAFIAMSRIWLPSSEKVKIADADLRRLAEAALDLMEKNYRESGTFLDFVMAMKGKTQYIVRNAEYGMTRAFGFGARAVAHAFVLQGAIENIGRLQFARVTPEAATDIQRVFSGNFRKVDPESLRRAIAALNDLGTPLSQTSAITQRRTGELGKTTLQAITIGMNPRGEEIWTTAAMLKELEQNLPSVIKEAHAHSATSVSLPQFFGRGAANSFLSAWKTSAVTGLLIPNPRYWVNNVFGDMSQIWFGQGGLQAAKLSFQNLPANIPVLGKVWQNYGSQFALRFGGVPVLGTLTNAMFNPWLHAVWNNAEEAFQSKNGMIVTAQDARKWLVEDGIMDTFVHEELQQVFSRVAPGWVQRTLGGFGTQESLGQFAAFVQQRQRAALYLELLRTGATRAEARRATLDALFDWKNGVSEAEVSGYFRMIPFYRFWRLSLTQMAGAFLDPLIKPGPSFAASLTGDTKTARVRNQHIVWDKAVGTTQFYVREALAEEYEAQENERLALMQYTAEPWMRQKGPTLPFTLSDAESRHFQRTRGKWYDSAYVSMPRSTSLDTLPVLLLPLTVFGAIKAHLTGQRLTPDWHNQIWGPASGSLHPAMSEPLDMYYQTQISAAGKASGGSTRYSPAEAAMANAFPSLTGGTQKDPETGEERGSPLALTAFRMIPFFGVQLSPLIDSAVMDNPATDLALIQFRESESLMEQSRIMQQINPEEAQRLREKSEEIFRRAAAQLPWAATWFTLRWMGLGPYPASLDIQRANRGRAIGAILKPVEESTEPEFPGWQKNPLDIEAEE